MIITVKLIDNLKALAEGKQVSLSALPSEVQKALEDSNCLMYSPRRGSKVYVCDQILFRNTLTEINEGFSNLDHLRRCITEDLSRGEQAKITGNSKMKKKGTFKGFLLNTFHNIEITVGGKIVLLEKHCGIFTFVYDWESLEVPSDALIIGIENPENFRFIEMSKNLFVSQLKEDEHSIIFVSRYPQEQTTFLRKWLQTIPNRYLHFGDFDLKGISIFQSEYEKHLGKRAEFLIPDDIELRIQSGDQSRYKTQEQYTRNVRSDNPKLQWLIDLINKYQRCYDQEGYEYSI